MKKLYSPGQARKLSNKEARAAYSELRSIANKRIQRLNKLGFTDYRSEFPTIKQITETSYFTIESALADVSAFLRSNRTTVKGVKKFYKDFKQTMTEMGYGDTFKNDVDIYRFGIYMDYLRDFWSDKLFDSGDALDVYQEGQRLNIPLEQLLYNYDIWVQNLDKMETLRRSPGGKAFSQQRIDKLRKKWS